MRILDKIYTLFWLFQSDVVEDNEKRTDVLPSKHIY